MPSPYARVSGSVRVVLCGLMAVFPLAGCGLFFHDDGVEQQTSKALSTFQSGGLSGIGANTLSDQAKLDAAEVNANIALNQSMRRYDLARLLGDARYIAAKCSDAKDSARKHGRQAVGDATCPLLVFIAEVDSRRDALALNTSHKYAKWQLLLFADPTSDSTNPLSQSESSTYGDALKDYKKSGRTDFTSCQAFKDPHEPANTPAERMFHVCRTYMRFNNIPRPIDDVLNDVDAKGVTGRIPDVKTALANRKSDLEGLQQAEIKMKGELDAEQKDLASAKPGEDEVEKGLQKVLDTLTAADTGAATLNHPEYAPGAKLAAIKFRNTNLNAALHATVPATAPASGASAANAAQEAGDSGGQPDLAIASIISGATTLAGGHIGPPAPSSLLDLQAKMLAGHQVAIQGQIDAVKAEVVELDNQLHAYVTEFVLLNAASNALDDALGALAHSACRATNLGEMLELRACAAARVPLSEALTLYDRAWIEGRAPGNASEIRLAQLDHFERQSSAAANFDARVAVDTEALSALASAGKSGIAPETIASFIQALATVVIAARVH
ncbi:hypothetical protein [Burkholderia contaminans]|uniref:hypothetical protein n=1 Tax=Burkholderia contaminans TaxID=488447 RepID=UPI00115F9386|nr:hypothetical protein [Burkholderia contaminans]